MQKAIANISLPFEVSYVPGLDVALKVYDTTSGSPILISTKAMAHVFNGTYLGFYTFASNKTYLINISVYTDETFADNTVDTNYPPSSATYTTMPSETPSVCDPGCEPHYEPDHCRPCGEDGHSIVVNQPYQEYLLGFPQVLHVVCTYTGVMPANLGVQANELNQRDSS